MNKYYPFQRSGNFRVLGFLTMILVMALGVITGQHMDAAMAATVVAGITEQSTPDEHKRVDKSMALSKLRSDIFTLDTVMRNLEQSGQGLGGRTAEAVKVQWEEDDELPRADAINGAVSAGSSGASVNWTVDNGNYWRKDDLVYLPDNATTPGTVVYVAGVNGNVLTVYRIDQATSETAFGTVPAVANNEAIYRLSNAKEDNGNASDPRSTMPVDYYNYVQHMDATISISEIRAATKNYTENDWTRNQEGVLWDFRTSLEMNQIFGNRSKINDPTTGKQRTTQAGITRYLTTNDLTYTTGSLTESNLIDWMRQLFSGNNGSRKRMLFATPRLSADIDKILIASGTLQSSRGEKVLGVNATKIKTTFGELAVMNHPGLNRLGKVNWGLILDPTNVRRVPLINMKTKKVGDNDVHGETKQWYEVTTTEVRKEMTHAVVRDTATDSFN